MYGQHESQTQTVKAVLGRIPTMDKSELEWAVEKLTAHIDTLEGDKETISSMWIDACHERDRISSNLERMITANRGQAETIRNQGFSLVKKRLEATG